MRDNDGSQFDRLPATDEERTVRGRATRAAVVDFFTDRYGIPAPTFGEYTFWEKGAGKVWALAPDADLDAPVEVESLGLPVLRTRQEHWKPTTNAVQRFGDAASRNVCHLDGDLAARFVAGEDVEPDWDGDWGYLIVVHALAGSPEPIGVGLYLDGELRSVVPKARQLPR
ncbi:MAG: hypothetical protein ABEJ08_01925 [Halobacteriaceae archaeon]